MSVHIWFASLELTNFANICVLFKIFHFFKFVFVQNDIKNNLLIRRQNKFNVAVSHFKKLFKKNHVENKPEYTPINYRQTNPFIYLPLTQNDHFQAQNEEKSLVILILKMGSFDNQNRTVRLSAHRTHV